MTSHLRHIATEPANLNQKLLGLERSPHIGPRSRSHFPASDSDGSIDTASLSQDSQAEHSPQKLSPGLCPSPRSIPSFQQEHVVPAPPCHQPRKKAKAEWEILEGLREGQRCEENPNRYEGFLLKRRKWPLKGWHKRYFVLDKGILTYAKTPNEMARDKVHASIDVGLSVISTKVRGRRVDIDADEYIYHLKVKTREQFGEWVQQLRHHRLYRQHEIAFGNRDSAKALSPVEDVPLPLSPVLAMCQSDLVQSFAQRSARSPNCANGAYHQGKVNMWLADSAVLDDLNKDLTNVQQTIYQLSSLLEQLKQLTTSASTSSVEISELGPVNQKKERRRFLLRRKKINKGNSTDFSTAKAIDKRNGKELENRAVSLNTSSVNIHEMAHLSTSNPNLPMSDENFHPCSLPEPSQLYVGDFVDHRPAKDLSAHEEFISLAKDVHSSLRSAYWSIQGEKERLRQSLDNNDNIPHATNNNNHANLVLQQNSELKARLQRIHAESEITETSGSPDPLHKSLQQSLSYESSSVLSISEYFDAAEYLGNTDSSTEASLSDEEEEDDGSFTSENSEAGTEYTPTQNDQSDEGMMTGRRSKLPAMQPDKGDFNLWNLLCKNIGKDLSKVCMPVTLNEPLNTLQRLCEELEYCELIEKAAEIDDPFERMVYVAAFAVSGYGNLFHRASHKPFNPLLGETYENIREDKGFRFIAEQVSHHPPISVCYAESKNYTLWQDMRIKTTFWGKSMEIQPIGSVNLLLSKHNAYYKWNKVTTCIHNVFSGQRWVDQYGELSITNGVANCKLQFIKASYWSSKRHELRGTVTNKQGKVVHHLFGHWNEGLYCGVAPSAKCIWRPAAMPEEYKLYYGFTQFAVELNELDSQLAELLPPTDTRFRPDQRLLEEGDIAGAEVSKLQLEQQQRERKKKREETGLVYEPLWFRKRIIESNEEVWEYGGLYWQTRCGPGFSSINFPVKLW